MSEPRWLVGGDAVLAIAADAPTVWLVDIDDPVARMRAEAVGLMSGELRAVAGRHDAGERLNRRRLARLLLAAAGECHPGMVAIDHDALGAPVVVSPTGWHVSLAARWPLCTIGIAPVPIGVDVEAVGDPLPDKTLTEGERRQHSFVAPGLTRGPAFFGAGSGTPGQARGDEKGRTAAARWAAKEAHAKWTGRPLDLDPAAIETAYPPLVTSRFGTTHCWLREELGYIAAVCA